MKNTILFLLLFLCPIATVWAQQNTIIKTNPNQQNPLFLQAKSTEAGILLKFIPSNAFNWTLAIENGFDIYRQELPGKESDHGKKINFNPIFPLPTNKITDAQIAQAQEELLWLPYKNYQARSKNGQQTQSAVALQQIYQYYLLFTTRERAASEVSGMEYLDKKVAKGKSYRYEIKIKNVKETVENRGFVSAKHHQKGLTAPTIFADGGDQQVHLQWRHSAEHSPFIAFLLERSTDGKNFENITENPFYFTKDEERTDDFMHYFDKIKGNDQTYFYRMAALDFWGEKSHISDSAEVKGLDKTPPTAAEIFKADIDSSQAKPLIKLTWEKAQKELDFAGYVVLRGSRKEKMLRPLHEALLPTKQVNYVDKTAQVGVPYVYALVAMDVNGNYSQTEPVNLQISDKEAPQIPQNFVGEISQAGIVKLTWSPNVEGDLKGYRVYSAPNNDKEFICLTPTPLTASDFSDTLNLNRLNRTHFYKIVALDDSYNHSGYSEFVKIILPDTIAPLPVSNLSIQQKGDEIILNWQKSTSNDVIGYRILRKSDGNNKWEEAAILKSAVEQEWQDSDFSKQTWLGYHVITLDDSGLETASKPVYLEFDKLEKLPVIGKMEAKNDKNKVALSWEKPPLSKGFRYLLFKAEKGKPAKLYQSLTDNFFVDTKVTSNRTYEYFVVVQAKNGQTSERGSSALISL